MNKLSQHDVVEHSNFRSKGYLGYKHIVSALVFASLTLVGCREESKQVRTHQQETKKAQTPTDIYIVQAQSLIFPSGQEKMITPDMQEEINKFQAKIGKGEKVAGFRAEEALVREVVVGTFINILFHLNFVKEHFGKILEANNFVSTENISIQNIALQKMDASLKNPELKKLYEIARPKDNTIDCELISALYVYFLAQENLARKSNIEAIRLVGGIFIRKSGGYFEGHTWIEYKEKGGTWTTIDPTNAGKEKDEDIFIPYSSIEIKIDPENRALFPPLYQERINLNK